MASTRPPTVAACTALALLGLLLLLTAPPSPTAAARALQQPLQSELRSGGAAAAAASGGTNVRQPERPSAPGALLPRPGRRLAQPPETARERCLAGSEPAAEQAVCTRCDELQRGKTAACMVWIDRIATTAFPRGSTELPTDEQRKAALAALKEHGAPSLQ